MEPSLAVQRVPKVQVPKGGCHLGRRGGPGIVPSKEIQGILCPCDSPSEGWEKLGSICLESQSQIFQETRRIPGLVQFTGT